MAEVDASGKTWVTFDDHLGSPRFQWDGAANPVEGTDLVRRKYAPFGEYLNDPATQAKFAKGFTNHEQTDPSGLIYMQARFYAPMYGRFLSPDPARDQHFEQTQSWNIYSYVRNSPTMALDINGMEFSWSRFKKAMGFTPENAKAAGDFESGLREGARSLGTGLANRVMSQEDWAKAGIDTSYKAETPTEYVRNHSGAHFAGRALFETVLLFCGLGEEADGERLASKVDSLVVRGGELSAAAKTEGLGSLLNSSKFEGFLKSKGSALQFSNTGDAAKAFSGLQKAYGATADAVKTYPNGAQVFSVGKTAFTLRADSALGQTISVKVADNPQQLVIRFH